MIHVWPWRSEDVYERASDLACVRLSMNSHAPTMARRMSGIHMSPARPRCTSWSGSFTAAPETPTMMTSGTSSWAAATPRFPPAALSPSAKPLCRSG